MLCRPVCWRGFHWDHRAGASAVSEVPQLIGEENELSLAVEQATSRLRQELAGRVPEATIAACVSSAFDELRDARIKTYVPVLTYRLARERLSSLVDTRN